MYSRPYPATWALRRRDVWFPCRLSVCGEIRHSGRRLLVSGWAEYGRILNNHQTQAAPGDQGKQSPITLWSRRNKPAGGADQHGVGVVVVVAVVVVVVVMVVVEVVVAGVHPLAFAAKGETGCPSRLGVC